MGVLDLILGLIPGSKKKKAKKKSSKKASAAKDAKASGTTRAKAAKGLKKATRKVPKKSADSAASKEGVKRPRPKDKVKKRPKKSRPEAMAPELEALDDPRPAKKRTKKTDAAEAKPRKTAVKKAASKTAPPAKKKKAKKSEPDAGISLASGNTAKKKKKRVPKINAKDMPEEMKLSAGKKTKGRKKAKKVKLPKGEASAEGFGVSLGDEQDDQGKWNRTAFRVPTRDLEVSIAECEDVGTLFPAHDISVTGIGVKLDKRRFKLGETITITIWKDETPQAQDVKVKVMRFTQGILGCQFKDLDRVQEDDLYKIVLAKQKEMAEKKKGPDTPKTQAQPESSGKPVKFEL